MLTFVKHHLESIAGVQIYPVISFVIFFLFFLGLLVYVARMRKREIEEMSQLPLDDASITDCAIN